MTDGHGDLGWLRIVLWRNPSLSLEGFPGYPSTYSSWEWHFLPYISIWSALSYLWPFGDLNYLLLFITLPPVLIFYFLAKTLKAIIDPKPISKKIIIILITLILGTMGPILPAIAFPHYELWQGALIMAAFYYAKVQRKKIAYGFLFLGTLVKEDASFYFVVILMVLYFTFDNWRRFILLASSILFLPLVYLVSNYFIAPPNSLLKSQYLGDPPLKHVTIDFLKNRLIENINVRSNLVTFAFFITVLFFCIYYKNMLGLKLILVTLVFFIVGFLGFQTEVGTLRFYRGLPVWMGLVVAYLVLIGKAVNLRNKSLKFLYLALIPLLFSVGTNDFNYLARQLLMIQNIPNYQIVENVAIQVKKDNLKTDNHFYLYAPKLLRADAQTLEVNNTQNNSVENNKNGTACFVHLAPSAHYKYHTPIDRDDILTKLYTVKPFYLSCRNSKP